MPSPVTRKHSEPDNPQRHVNDGRIFITEIQPKYPETKIGSILLPDKVAMGAAFSKENGDLITADKTIVYGKVTACGLRAERNTCRAFPDAEQRGFPLPGGTYVKISRAVDHKISPTESCFNTWDIFEWTLPHEPVPEWVPEEVAR